MKSWFKKLFQLNNLSDLEHLAQSNGIDVKYPYRHLKGSNDKRSSILVLDYNQIEAKGSNPISNLCRGLLLDSESLDVIARPFHRFFNYQEQNSDLLLLDKLSLSNSSIDICDKLDGSLIKLFFHYPTNQWLIGTRAGCGEHPMMGGKYSYLQAFVDVITNNTSKYSEQFMIQIANRNEIPQFELNQALADLNQFAKEENLDTDCTYLFELCTPFNSNVVRYTQPMVSFLAANHNHIQHQFIQQALDLNMPYVFLNGNMESKKELLKHFFELEKKAGVPSFQHQFKSEFVSYPARYQMKSDDINEVLNVVKMMKGREQEGFVVYIDGIPKVKIKSAEYVTIHHAVGNNTFTASDAIGLVLTHEEDEYLALAPERESLLKPYIKIRDMGQQLIQDLYQKTLNHFKDNELLKAITPKEKLDFFDVNYNYEKDFITAGAELKKELFVFLSKNAPTKTILGLTVNMLKGNSYHVLVSNMLESPKKAKEYFAELFKYDDMNMSDFELRNRSSYGGGEN